MRRPNLVRYAGFCVAMLFRVVPRRHRFRLSVRAAAWLEPFIARTRAFAQRSRLKTDGLRETSLEFLLMMLTRHGTLFDPVVRLEGAAMPARDEGPILLISTHAMLGSLYVRQLWDEGYDPILISADAHFPVAGTREGTRVLRRTESLLLQVRRQLLDRTTLIVAAIDRADEERRTVGFQTGDRTMLLSEALIRLSLRLGARIVFFLTRLDSERQVVASIRMPSPESRTSVDVLTDFAQFIDAWERSRSESVALHGHETGTELGVELTPGGKRELR